MDTLRLALVALVVVSGCASLQPPRQLVVHPLAHVNRDRRFYLVVRAIKDQDFIADDYQKIAAQVFAPTRDPSVRLVRLVSPGRDDKVLLTLPDEEPFAVYALFTEPGEPWKVLVTPPLARIYELVLDDNRLTVRPKALWPWP
jgi:hypothetical protein